VSTRHRGGRALALAGAGAAVARHPRLWPVAVRQAWLLRAPGRLAPPAGYLAFRMVTQYGDPDARPVAADVVSYLRWCRQFRALQR